MKRERIKSIDSLRGIACCIIAFFWHYQNMQPKSAGVPLYGIFHSFYDYGQYFVELFFMISGFVMAYCYREKIESGEGFFEYLSKRYKHLYPLFFITLLVTAVLQVFYYHIFGAFYVYKCSVWHFILNLLGLQSGWFSMDQSFNGPAWCISVEIFLYILFYITTYFTRKDKNYYTITNLFVFFAAIIFMYLNRFNLPILNMFVMRGVACFYGGVLICELNDRIDCKKKEKFALGSFIILIVFRICLAVMPYGFWDNESYGQLCLILFQWPIVLFAVINCKGIKRVLEIKPLQFLGRISMNIFLWHIPIQIIIKIADKVGHIAIDYSSVVLLGIYIIAVLLISVVSDYIGQKGKRNYFLYCLAAAISMLLIQPITNVTGIRLKAVYETSLSYADMSKVIEMQEGTVLKEVFLAEETVHIEKIQFYAITWNKPFSQEQMITISIRDVESGNIIYSVDRFMSILQDGNVHEIAVENVSLYAGKQYALEFTSNTMEGQERMALMFTNVSDNEGVAYINNNVTNEHICAEIWTRR